MQRSRLQSMEITPHGIIEISSYFTVISHVKGRLRARVNPKIKDEVKDISLSDIQSIPQKINGIKMVKINKIVASVTIEYDNNVFGKELWDDLISGANMDNSVKLLTKLQKEVM